MDSSTLDYRTIGHTEILSKIEIFCHFQLFESKFFTFTWHYLCKRYLSSSALNLSFIFSVPQYILWKMGSCNSQFFLMSISTNVQSCFYLTAVCSFEGYCSHQLMRTTSNEVINSRVGLWSNAKSCLLLESKIWKKTDEGRGLQESENLPRRIISN